MPCLKPRRRWLKATVLLHLHIDCSCSSIAVAEAALSSNRTGPYGVIDDTAGLVVEGRGRGTRSFNSQSSGNGVVMTMGKGIHRSRRVQKATRDPPKISRTTPPGWGNGIAEGGLSQQLHAGIDGDLSSVEGEFQSITEKVHGQNQEEAEGFSRISETSSGVLTTNSTGTALHPPRVTGGTRSPLRQPYEKGDNVEDDATEERRSGVMLLRGGATTSTSGANVLNTQPTADDQQTEHEVLWVPVKRLKKERRRRELETTQENDGGGKYPSSQLFDVDVKHTDWPDHMQARPQPPDQYFHRRAKNVEIEVKSARSWNGARSAQGGLGSDDVGGHRNDGNINPQQNQQHAQNQQKQREQLAAEGNDGGMVSFKLDGTTEAFMPGGEMRDYLNNLVDRSAAAVKNQTCNIAFVKTHKTASTTMATILYRYGKRHGLNVAHFEGHHSVIGLPEAARQINERGEPVDVMHYHHAWDGYYKGSWGEATAMYRVIMRDPTDVKLVTVLREPVSHFLSYYYYFLQPDTGLSVQDYFEVAGNPHDPRRETMQVGEDLTWHGAMVLHNPLCAEFGIRSPVQLESFLRNDLPEFSMILLTEQFEEGLAIFMRMFNWEPIDLTYCRVIETKSGVPRYDGKMLLDVPKAKNLSPELLAKIRQQTNMDLTLYKAAAKLYLQHKANYESHLKVDMARIRQAQSAVHGYLKFDRTSDAHAWYEGDVKCFDNPSPVRNF